MLAFAKLNKTVHDRKNFSCGSKPLDDYLARYAGQNQKAGNSTTHVLINTDNPKRILGFVSLTSAQLDVSELSLEDFHKVPLFPVPAIRIARLAVDVREQGKSYGRALLAYSVKKTLALREVIGVRILVVDAKDEKAAKFYRKFGFTPTIRFPLKLYLFI